MSSSTRLDVGVDRERRDLRRVVAILIVLLLVVVAIFLSNRESSSENQFSAFTADQLLHDWPDADAFPLVLPAQLPPGTHSDNSASFALSSVVVEPTDPADRRVWVQYYESDALGGAFRVFQRPDAVQASRPCGPMLEVQHIERALPGGTITVCSNELSKAKALEYWSTVVLTQDLNSIGWLPN